MKLTLTLENLKKCVKDKIITPVNGLDISKHVQPSSIDIALGSKAYLLSHRALAPNISMKELGPKISLEELDLSKKTLFLKGHTYLVETDMDLNIPKDICAKCSPKSSIGRIDVLVRAVCSVNGMYDIISPGSKGRLFLEITPQSFNVLVKKGVTMSQIRLFKEESNGGDITNESHEKEESSLEDIEVLKRSILGEDGNPSKDLFSFDYNMKFLSIEINEGSFGYVAKNTQTPIDLTKTRSQKSSLFFTPLVAEKGVDNKLQVVIEKNRFYIFHTKEFIKVPLTHSIEMLPYAYVIGDFRSHYAGFFDPGFGGSKGATAVLEVRSSEDIVIFDSQPVSSVINYKNYEVPSIGYGELNNNYQNQKGPKLSKFFIVDN